MKSDKLKIEKEITGRFIQALHSLVGPNRTYHSKMEAGKLIGMDSAYIYKMEHNIMAVQLRHIRAFHSRHGLNLEWLFTGIGEMFYGSYRPGPWDAKDPEKYVLQEKAKRVQMQVR